MLFISSIHVALFEENGRCKRDFKTTLFLKQNIDTSYSVYFFSSLDVQVHGRLVLAVNHITCYSTLYASLSSNLVYHRLLVCVTGHGLDSVFYRRFILVQCYVSLFRISRFHGISDNFKSNSVSAQRLNISLDGQSINP